MDISDGRLDPRARRTVSALKQALTELAPSTPLPEIGVAPLCRAAGVHRTTFYKHFETVSDVASLVVSDLVNRIDRGCPGVGNDYATFLVALLQHTAEHRSTYVHFLGPEGDPALIRTVSERLAVRALRSANRAAARGIHTDMGEQTFARMIGFGSYGLIDSVLSDETVDPVRVVAAFLAILPENTRLILAA